MTTIAMPQPSAEPTLEKERQVWMALAFSKAQKHKGEQHLSSHALLLDIEIQLAFCAGAWISVIVLAFGSIEATIRQIDQNNYEDNAKTLFGGNKDLEWLREMRNELIHAGEPDTPSKVWKVDGHGFGPTHAALEDDAKRAVEIMFDFLYGRKHTWTSA